MGSTYKTDFNVFNGTDYDRHYFSTTADQVKMRSGETVEKAVLDCKALLPGKITILDVYIPADSLGSPSIFSLPIGYDPRECAIIPVGYYIGDSNSRRSYNFTIYGVNEYPAPGSQSFGISAQYEAGDNTGTITFCPPADVGAVTVRLLLVQGDIDDVSSSAAVG